ncbi:MAG: YhdH/YhfP family quinone oxidoreductase [Halorhodospira halophila]|uniref:YhdH/YhfP family quinone oxidoreductase n=1 Tax=Halorhodospira TaxID=85108 RepID=UPI00191251A4|nr:MULTISPECIES: YhdH/YhfP family quinone oxidoreductase [Halorhodospira]MBK5937426.1 oxidoreductase [Halorhodospira halophila]MBK5943451.1 oxidoreductase [Halorhodospira halophila]MCC3751234.1 YhdH/YhfP family quinone oxidoreductase [Halorhodospira halophila]MCG5526981.1 YhdH/YhfP family quinone oxidoreductase [Halorhodospira halophila]MCG5532398.1 YhdH/YhfP family quinone oxidoreductase [Halorhodospira sp. 9621]
MQEFTAWRVPESGREDQGGVVTLGAADLPAGDVLVRVAYSSVNYKDALALTGQGKILRRFPITPGIDAAGVVVESDSDDVKVGAQVLITGCGLGEVHDGGFAEYVRIPADWVVPLPGGLTPRQAMALGTAGFTAALALIRMEAAGQTPALGDVLVTGASGGVGSIAVDLFSNAGYRVVAVSGKKDAASYLHALGAAEVVSPEAIGLSERPLDRARFAGVVDNVGGPLLAGLLPQVEEYGNVASIGLAGGVKLETTVMPWILRGVSMLGVSSANCPRPLRLESWRRLGEDLRPQDPEGFVTREVELDGLRDAAEAMLARQVTGRTLVRVGGDAVA